MENIKVNIRKPLYGNFVYINSSVIDRAIRLGVKMEVTVPNGTAIVDPVKWKAEGKVMRKVFKFADNPMILIGGTVPVPLPQALVKGEIININPNQLKLF